MNPRLKTMENHSNDKSCPNSPLILLIYSSQPLSLTSGGMMVLRHDGVEAGRELIPNHLSLWPTARKHHVGEQELFPDKADRHGIGRGVESDLRQTEVDGNGGIRGTGSHQLRVHLPGNRHVEHRRHHLYLVSHYLYLARHYLYRVCHLWYLLGFTSASLLMSREFMGQSRMSEHAQTCSECPNMLSDSFILSSQDLWHAYSLFFDETD